MISSKNEHVFIRDLSDLALQMMSDAWWDSMNVGLKWPITWNNSRHAPCGDSVYTAELRRLAAPASYVSFVIKFFAIHQNMGPAQLANTRWQKCISQS